MVTAMDERAQDAAAILVGGERIALGWPNKGKRA